MSDVTLTVDHRGRLTLGKRYADALMIVQHNADGTIRLIPAKAVPAGEAWLFENKAALRAVQEGLDQAKNREFVESPDFESDADQPE